MAKKPANTPALDANAVIDTIATAPSIDKFFTKTTALVTVDDITDVVAHYRRERAQWLEAVKKKMEKKGEKGK